MNQYSIIISVLFDEPMKLKGAGVPIEGSAQTFWVTAESLTQAVEMAESQIDQGIPQAVEGIIIGPDEITRAQLPDSVDITQPGVFHKFEPAMFGPQNSAPKWWEFWRRR